MVSDEQVIVFSATLLLVALGFLTLGLVFRMFRAWRAWQHYQNMERKIDKMKREFV